MKRTKRDILDIKSDLARDYGYQNWREMMSMGNGTLINRMTDRLVKEYHKEQLGAAPDKEVIEEMFLEQAGDSEQLGRYNPLVQELISIAFVAGATWFRKQYFEK